MFIHFVIFQFTASQGGWQKHPDFLDSCLHFNSQPHKEADILPGVLLTISYSFQLTASQGGWLSVFNYCSTFIEYFNSQPHKEANCQSRFFCASAALFQLTASQGGWQKAESTNRKYRSFQLTASQGGWRDAAGCVFYIWNYFNSQPHKEADHSACKPPFFREISTHSLTRRLTTRICQYRES